MIDWKKVPRWSKFILTCSELGIHQEEVLFYGARVDKNGADDQITALCFSKQGYNFSPRLGSVSTDRSIRLFPSEFGKGWTVIEVKK